MKTIFISHAVDDADLASSLQRVLEMAFDPPVQIFRSSDAAAIEGGADWYATILNELARSDVCLALLTPNSIYAKPWLPYETGGAFALYREREAGQARLVALRARGVGPNIVPGPLQRLQSVDLSNEVALKKLFHNSSVPTFFIGEEAVEGSDSGAGGHAASQVVDLLGLFRTGSG
jgi:hypothetical protein